MSEHTRFTATYEVTAEAEGAAVQEATQRLSRSLAVGIDYNLESVEATQTDDLYEISLTFELTKVSPHIKTNLAFHTFFPKATVTPA